VTERDLIAALSPVQRVALTLWGEARGSSPALRAGIASVLLNRVKAQHPHWGFTADEVCLQPKQFSCWNEGADRNHLTVIDAARHLLNEGAAGPILRECLGLADAVCHGTHKDTVRKATHYYSPAAMVPKDRVPVWARGLTPVAVIDGTKFYAGVS
jgi:hypothetical protein